LILLESYAQVRGALKPLKTKITKIFIFTCHRCLFLEKSCLCYLFEIIKLTRISTFFGLGWPHVCGYATG